MSVDTSKTSLLRPLIAQARQLCEDCGRRPATVAEARALLGITMQERAVLG